MEIARVDLHNWPRNPDETGGWVTPHGDPISRWIVTRIHARYQAPEIPPGSVDEHGRPVRHRRERRAFLVDLDGEGWGLDDHERVLVHQTEPNGMWAVKTVDDDYLERIEPIRVREG